ncbi:MAG: asparagine synthase B [Bdellovibrionales bacterium]|jgi:asparagine synthase (glutamine-hydrolysing)|nr:asparagine synthase B [Bdellovibrionales bacterium]
MCGILAMIGSAPSQLVAKQSKKMSHRGPDERGIISTSTGHILSHERLSIIDIHTGKQPIKGDKNTYLIHNGEIYNHLKLKNQLKETHTQRTNSDSEIILHLYEEQGEECINLLDGVFAFVISDQEKVFAGRDPLGVKPLFYGHDQNENLWFASEVKALIDVCTEINEFPPGHYFTQETGFIKYFNPDWMQGATPNRDGSKIRETLTNAVKKRLMSDVPLGVLLSGGLDSSLVTSIVTRELKKQNKTVKSFSVGLSQDSEDLLRAREVADFLDTDHHEILFTPEEGIELLKELIHKVETYDVTTIRASTPMYIMSKYIREQGIKVVLSGEGADEIFGGYLYFGNAPSDEEFHNECVRRIKRLYTADIQRADRSTMGAGIEARVPFLDKEFLQETMLIDPALKTIKRNERMEKHILRQAFDTKEQPYLPEHILWRQKEQFSDGVGYSWVDELKKYAEAQVSDSLFEKRETLFPHNTPSTKEAFFYRTIYTEHFPHKDCPKLVKKWVPRWQKDKDPSGRANTTHNESYYDNTKKEEVENIQPPISL